MDTWNEEEQQEPYREDHQEHNQGENVGLPIQESHDVDEHAPPALSRSASRTESATTIIASALELPCSREISVVLFVVMQCRKICCDGQVEAFSNTKGKASELTALRRSVAT